MGWSASRRHCLNGPEADACAPSESFTCNLRSLKRGEPRLRTAASRLKDELLPKLEYSLITAYYAAERATIFELFARFDGLYRERKRQLGGLDYDDLEEYAVRLLEDIRMSGAACKTNSTRC